MRMMIRRPFRFRAGARQVDFRRSGRRRRFFCLLLSAGGRVAPAPRSCGRSPASAVPRSDATKPASSGSKLSEATTKAGSIQHEATRCGEQFWPSSEKASPRVPLSPCL